MRNLKDMLTPDDFALINADTSVNWIPKDPQEVILPYINIDSSEEEEKIEEQRRKSKEVIDGYSKIIEECKQLEAVIEDRCKNVKTTINRQEHLPVIQAMARVFGQGEQTEITFEHYKACIKALADLNNQIPKPGDK